MLYNLGFSGQECLVLMGLLRKVWVNSVLSRDQKLAWYQHRLAGRIGFGPQAGQAEPAYGYI